MSDQDFFFDEDEQAAPAKEAKPARRTSTTAKGTSASSAAPEAGAGMMGQSVTMAVAALIGVIALLAGVIIGIVIPVGGTPQTTAPTTVAPAGGGSAPQLSPEQLQGGELPEGHPNIGGEGSETATGTGK